MKDDTECCEKTILFCGNMALSQIANQHETSMMLDLSAAVFLSPLDISGIKFDPCLYIRPSVCSSFIFCSITLISPLGNHLNFIHKFVDHIWNTYFLCQSDIEDGHNHRTNLMYRVRPYGGNV